MNTEKVQCANDPCLCEVTGSALDSGDPTEAYCSDACRDDSVGEEQEACACGHPPCDAMN